MKNRKYIVIAMVLLACAATAFAQMEKRVQQRTLSEALDSWITHTEILMMQVADAMPADKYAFAPDPTKGEFKGVRTFAEQLKHLAANNYRMAAWVVEEKTTAKMENETGPDSVRTKAEIVEYVKGSFAALHKAVGTIDLKNAVQPTRSPSQWQKTRVSFAVDAVAHSFDHYGQLVEYLRMNGIVPPESRPKKQQ